MATVSICSQHEKRNDDRIFSYLSKFEDFIIADKERSSVFATYVKYFSDLKCTYLPLSFTTVTPVTVHVQGFEPEQIYQQLKSINETRLKSFITTVIKNKAKDKTFGNLLRPPSPKQLPNETNHENEEDIVSESIKKVSKKKKSVTFFDTHALNKFLNEQDTHEMSKFNQKLNIDDDLDVEYDDDDDDDDDDDENLFADDDVDNAKYEEFFDPPMETKQKKKKMKEKIISDEPNPIDDDDDDDGDIDLENKSSFEKYQIQLKRQIKSIEDDMLSAKPWQLTGEIEGPKRPENSLLEEYLQYDRTTRLPPAVTTETTETIEDLIKQRIRDRAFDDVERKKKSSNGNEAQEFKKEIVLEHEKSQMSLAQVYEQEYLKKQSNDKIEQKDERHECIRKSMQDLFVDLDALSNFRFTPRPPVPEVTIVNNVSTILMEDVVPTTVNNSAMLAPEEVHIRPKGDVKAKNERTDTDKKHARRLHKHKLKVNLKEKIKKSNPKDELKEEKQNLLKKLGKMKNVRIETNKNRSNSKTTRSSTKFFEQLQQSTLTSSTKKHRHSNEAERKDSKRLKL